VDSYDVIIAGGGIAGVSIALALRERGANVLVLERGEPGCEASGAAAGMLAATDPETPPALQPLALTAARMYPEFITKLERISGITTDFRRQGTIVLGEASPSSNYRPLSEADIGELEPRLQTRGHAAFLVEEDCVDPVLLMKTIVAAARLSGIHIRNNSKVERMRWTGTNVEVATIAGTFTGSAAVNCLGAWSGTPVRPRKGQMIYLRPQVPLLLEHVVRAPGAYIVPRSSGKVLVGTTVEDVGFDKSVDPVTTRRMHSSAARYIPGLESVAIAESWAGLRPGTPDDLPVIGPTAEQKIFLASGLFRNGILLAPAVADCVAALVLGKTPSLDIGPFSPARFTVSNPLIQCSSR
jgi:glycine oxidase